MYTLVIYLRKRSATVVAYLPTPNGRPLSARVARSAAEDLIANAAVRKRWRVGNAEAVSARIGGRALVMAVQLFGCHALDVAGLDEEIRRAYRQAEDLIRAAALRKGVPEEVLDSYIRAWLKADGGRLPPDDPDAKAVASGFPAAVVWAYGGYLVHSPPWC
ncbi:MAG: hypothetical protein ACP5HD_05595 [Thermoproteus sp.]